MFDTGSKILFSLGNEIYNLKDNLGIIIDKKDDKSVVLRIFRGGCSIYVRPNEAIDDLSNIENVRQDIIDYYTPQIDELKSKLKSVTSEEKIQERVNKYADIKNRIIINCKRIAICTDDEEFENRLKEIGKLKKQLNSIDLDCADIIRKENGKIKYEIKQIEQRMNGSLMNISDETIMKVFEY